MAGDLRVLEGITLGSGTAGPTADAADRIVHHYGRVGIVQRDPAAPAAETAGALRAAADLSDAELEGLDNTERLGAAALRLRQSEAYRGRKEARPRSGESWDMTGCTRVVPPPQGIAAAPAGAGPTSSWLEGSVAVGIVLVQGPTEDLQFSGAEQNKVVAEVQNGLGWFASVAPQARLEFHYDIRLAPVTVTADPDAEDLEARWRDPALAALGQPAGGAGAAAYAEHLRTTLGTRWTYVAFFSKYPLNHFAYAFIGGPYMVMDYTLDGWGPDNMDRVFAHETGHVFGAPDEYASSGCSCDGRWGRFQLPNSNCQSCAPGGGTTCLMRGNDFVFCQFTPAHLGLWLDTPLVNRNVSKVAAVADAATGDRAAVTQRPFHGGFHQRFRLEAVGDGLLRAVARHSGKVLQIRGASADDGAPVEQGVWNGGDHQRFLMEDVGGHDVRLTARHSGKVLDVLGASADDGAALVQRMWTGDAGQRWGYRGTAVQVRHSGKVLDVQGASYDNGANIIQWRNTTGDNQEFLVQPLPDGYVRLVAKHSGKVLDVFGASGADGAYVVQWDWNGGDNQRFRMEDTGDKYVRFTAKHSGKVLDVSGASLHGGAQIVQWPWNGGDNQRWLLP